jgi:hypothetical protein
MTLQPSGLDRPYRPGHKSKQKTRLPTVRLTLYQSSRESPGTDSAIRRVFQTPVR